MVQIGAKLVNGAYATPLPSNFEHNLTIYDILTSYVWLGLAMGQAWGQKCKLAMLGGVQWWERPSSKWLETIFKEGSFATFGHLTILSIQACIMYAYLKTIDEIGLVQA